MQSGCEHLHNEYRNDSGFFILIGFKASDSAVRKIASFSGIDSREIGKDMRKMT
jgi:hypothetical protein